MQKLFALIGLALSTPLILFFGLLIYMEDFRSPVYVSNRVGKDKMTFKMFKLRSMKVVAGNNVYSTSEHDPRITKAGRVVRRLKVDELLQLLNVVIGDMAFVGPRPNVVEEVRNYSPSELKLLKVKPGITDFASIVFSDESQILKHSADPDADYNRLIWPMKYRLGIFYIEHKSLSIDLLIILLTLQNGLNRNATLKNVSRLLKYLKAPDYLCKFARRDESLEKWVGKMD